MKFLDIAYVVAEFDQVLKKHKHYSPDTVRTVITEVKKLANGLDMLGSFSKGYFYRKFAYFIRNDLDIDEGIDRSKVCHDFAYWLFVEMKDFSNITFHKWKMVITIDGEFGPRDIIVLDDNIDLISGTPFFDKAFFEKDPICNLEGAIHAFANILNENYTKSKGRNLTSTMHALYDSLELYGQLTTVKFKHEIYSF